MRKTEPNLIWKKKKKKKRTVSESLNSCVIRREEKIKRRGKNREM